MSIVHVHFTLRSILYSLKEGVGGRCILLLPYYARSAQPFTSFQPTSNRSTSSLRLSLPPYHTPPYAVPPLHPVQPPPLPHSFAALPSPPLSLPHPDPRCHSPIPVPIRAATVSPIILLPTRATTVSPIILLPTPPTSSSPTPPPLLSVTPSVLPPIPSTITIAGRSTLLPLHLGRYPSSAPTALRSRFTTASSIPNSSGVRRRDRAAARLASLSSSPSPLYLPHLSTLQSLFPSLRQRDRVESLSSSSASPGLAQEGSEASRSSHLPHIRGHSPIVFLSGFPGGGAAAATLRSLPSSSP